MHSTLRSMTANSNDPLNTARLQAALTTLEQKISNGHTVSAPAATVNIAQNPPEESNKISDLESEIHSLKARHVAARKLIDTVLANMEQHA